MIPTPPTTMQDNKQMFLVLDLSNLGQLILILGILSDTNSLPVITTCPHTGVQERRP